MFGAGHVETNMGEIPGYEIGDVITCAFALLQTPSSLTLSLL